VVLAWEAEARTLHDRSFLHRWEHFHYHLGSKYFPELGYDGLYAASLAAQRDHRLYVPTGPIVRDLRNNALVPLDAARDQVKQVVKRFEPGRSHSSTWRFSSARSSRCSEASERQRPACALR